MGVPTVGFSCPRISDFDIIQHHPRQDRIREMEARLTMDVESVPLWLNFCLARCFELAAHDGPPCYVHSICSHMSDR